MNMTDVPVRFSELKLVGTHSPAHYMAAVEAGRSANGRSRSRRHGSIVDALVLGGDYAVWPGTRRGKAWEAFEEENEDKLIVTAAEFEHAQRCVEALRANEHAARALRGLAHCQVDWKWLGRACRSELDVLNPDDGILTDLKTASSVHPVRFTAAAIRYGYHAQLWFYSQAAAFRGVTVRECYLVAVESAPPYPVTVLRLTRRALDAGERMCRSWMERLLACEAADEWPSYTQTIVDLDVPDLDDEPLIIGGEEVPLEGAAE